MKDYGLLQQRYLVGTYPHRGLTLVEGEGPYLIDQEGGRYLDLTSGYGVAVFGHRHPGLAAALHGQLDRVTVLHSSFANDARAEAAREIVRRCGGRMARVLFANSGAEANEAALKLAVLATGRAGFVACRGAFHGKTLGALAATEGAKYRGPFEPLLRGARFVPYGDPDALAEAVGPDTAAFIVEPIQGESGIVVPPVGYLARAAEICRAAGALLILDEIQTGTGRTGRFLASEADGAPGDIVTLGKGLGGGIPVGAAVVSEAVARAAFKGAHTSTFGGNPLAAAGITATLSLLDEARLAHVSAAGAHFKDGLRGLGHPFIKEVRGEGLMIGVQVAGFRDEILKALQMEKILAIPAGDDVVRFLPPYIIERSHADEALAAFGRVLEGPVTRTEPPCAAS